MTLNGCWLANSTHASADYKLSRMTLHRLHTIAAAALFWILPGCDNDAQNARSDSLGVAVTRPLPDTASALTTGWRPMVSGPAMILPATQNPATVSVVLPDLSDSTFTGLKYFDLTAMVDMSVEFFGLHGAAGVSPLLIVSRQDVTQKCLMWPQARLSNPPLKPWTVGFSKGRAVGVPLDSLEAMNSQDSGAFVREITGIASFHSQRGDSSFSGLPFSVRKAYRFSLGPVSGFVANIVRTINEEANPRAEHFLLVAERSSTGYEEAYHVRAAGSEESVQTNEILAMVRFVETGQPAIVFTFDYEDGGRVALLERVGDRRWQVSWRSAFAGC